MCTRIRNTVTGQEANNPPEMRQMLNVQELVLEEGYTSIEDDCCLCQVNVRATVEAAGWTYIEVDGDPMQVDVTPPKRRFSLLPFADLPLGTRFRYPGADQVWTIIEKHRVIQDGAMHGVIAQWEPDMLQKGRWTGQSLCSHLPESEGGDCPELVEAID